ncbi:MAG: fatty acyl-AMP ligase [Geitlerinemataceae cyanobacterium]
MSTEPRNTYDDRMNDSAHAFSGITLVELLRDRAQRQADRIAYRFSIDGETQTISLSYGELDRRSRSIAAHLQSFCVPGERVLLLYPPGLEYVAAFLACLYAGVVAIPAYPPRPNRSLSRLQSIVADSGASVALTTDEILPTLERHWVNSPQLATLKWIATDLLGEAAAAAWQPPDLDGDTLAFLQYTSGSTATPKGVRVTHGNLLHNLGGIYRSFRLSADSHVVSWLPMYHDMGLIGGVLEPLYGGFPVTLMSPLMFLQKPLRWLQAIAQYGATCSGGPNFAYDLCARKITPQQVAELDLSGWEVAFNGAEPISAAVLDRFARVLEPAGFRREAFYPCYGLAEATLFVSGGSTTAPPRLKTVRRQELEQHRVVSVNFADGENTRALVSCGGSLPDQHIAIVNPETLAPCVVGEVGEIWVCGASVADGYWQNPQSTKEIFRAQLAVPVGARVEELQIGLPAMLANCSFLRTGDLGFLDEGELFVTGRLKDMMILNGRNYYPQDIEWTVEGSHPSIRSNCTVAFSVDLNGEEQPIVMAEVDRSYVRTQRVGKEGMNATPDADGRELIQAIRRAVAREHDLQVHTALLLKPGSLPKTSSGKIQRRACRSNFLDGTLGQLVW